MALDKLVDSTQLDADLTTIANAIRTKGGTSEQLAFPNGMADAIAAIPSGEGAGGNYNIESVDDGNGGQILNITDAQGGTEITDGIVVKSRNASGYATEIDFYGTEIPNYCFGNTYSNTVTYIWRYLENINCKNSVVSVGSGAFNRSNITAIPQSILDNCTSFDGTGTFGRCSNITGAVEFKELKTWAGGDMAHFINCTGITKLSLPKLESPIGQEVFTNMTALTEFYAPRTSGVSTDISSRYPFNGDTLLQSIQLGSVGYGITSLPVNSFRGLTQSGLTVTLYCAGEKVDTFLANARSGATNATIIIKAGEDTTYNGVSYAAGETMITSEVA